MSSATTICRKRVELVDITLRQMERYIRNPSDLDQEWDEHDDEICKHLVN